MSLNLLLNTSGVAACVKQGFYILSVDFLRWGVLVFIPYEFGISVYLCVAQTVYPLNLRSLLGYLIKNEPRNIWYFDLRFVFKTVLFVSEHVIELDGLVLSILVFEPQFALLEDGDAYFPELL